jgi:hypothetical protein
VVGYTKAQRSGSWLKLGLGGKGKQVERAHPQVLLKYSRFGHFTPFSVVPEIGNCTEQRGK